MSTETVFFQLANGALSLARFSPFLRRDVSGRENNGSVKSRSWHASRKPAACTDIAVQLMVAFAFVACCLVQSFLQQLPNPFRLRAGAPSTTLACGRTQWTVYAHRAKAIALSCVRAAPCLRTLGDPLLLLAFVRRGPAPSPSTRTTGF